MHNYNLSRKFEVNAVSKIDQGVIMSCRRGPKTQKPKEYILRFPGIESVGEAAHLIGRKVACLSENMRLEEKSWRCMERTDSLGLVSERVCRAKHWEV
jgi:ribosomal protein L35AE/L33A